MGILPVCFRVFPSGRRVPPTTSRTYFLSSETRKSICEIGNHVQTLTRPSPTPISSQTRKPTTIIHRYRYRFRTPRHQSSHWAIVPSVWKRFMQRTPSRCSTSLSVYYKKSGEGRIIVWRRAIIYSCVTRLFDGYI